MELAQARVALVTAYHVKGNGVTVGSLGSNYAFDRTGEHKVQVHHCGGRPLNFVVRRQFDRLPRSVTLPS
jgi:hypothetical protein